MNGAPLVFVVVLNWNGWPDTLTCLSSLQNLTYPRVQVVVVDNCSSDGSAERIRAAHPEIPVLRTRRNLGFAGGNNVGIRYALERGASYVWILNNDTTVNPSTLSHMVATAEASERTGIVGSVLLTVKRPHRVQVWGGGAINWWLGTIRERTGPGAHIDHITGASMLVKRRLFEEVGLFEETYFFLLEDADLCSRAMARGWRLGVAGRSVVYHKGGASTEGDVSGQRSLKRDRFHSMGSGIFLGRFGGARLSLSVPLRVVGLIGRRIERGQIARIPVLVRDFSTGVRVGLRLRGTP